MSQWEVLHRDQVEVPRIGHDRRPHRSPCRLDVGPRAHRRPQATDSSWQVLALDGGQPPHCLGRRGRPRPAIRWATAAAARPRAGCSLLHPCQVPTTRHADRLRVVRAEEWDERYTADRQWSAEPNRLVAELLGDLPPGDAVDLAAGEGGTHRGWPASAGG